MHGVLDERSTAPHLHLLQARSCCAAGAAVERVRFGTVCHLILQLQVRRQRVDLVNHLHNSQSKNSEKSMPQQRHRNTEAASASSFVLPQSRVANFLSCFYFIFYFYFFWLAQEMQQNCSHIPLQTKLTSEIPLKLFGILSHQQRRTYHQRSSCPILVICSLLYLTTQRIDASSS